VTDRPVVAAITIGQTPRPDLLAELAAVLPDGVEVHEYGALDGIAANELPRIGFTAESPLATRLADGSQVVVEEAWLSPRVQAAVERAEADGAGVLVLLCAGAFEAVTSNAPLIRPATVVSSTLGARGFRTALVVVPSPRQLVASEAKWRSLGIDPLMLGVPLPRGLDDVVEAAADVPAVVLDYVGHPARLIDRLEDALESETDALLFDLGRYAAFATAEQVPAS